MMFGHPEAVVSKRLGVAGEIGGVAQRLAGIAALGHRRQIENGKGHHPRGSGPARNDFNVRLRRSAESRVPASREGRFGDAGATWAALSTLYRQASRNIGFLASQTKEMQNAQIAPGIGSCPRRPCGRNARCCSNLYWGGL